MRTSSFELDMRDLLRVGAFDMRHRRAEVCRLKPLLEYPPDGGFVSGKDGRIAAVAA